MRSLFKKLKKILPDIFVWLILIVFVVLVVVLLAIFGGSIMALLGLEYDSIKSVILFFVIAGIAAFPIEIIVSALPKVLISAGKLTSKQAIALFIIEDTILSVIVLSIVDYFMDSITATPLSIIIIALLMAVVSVYVDKDDE